jgi:hypothetical protein
MAVLTVDDDALEVRLSRLEKVAGLLRDLRVPRSAVREVRVVPEGLHGTTGIRAPGLGLPGRRKIGTWRGRHSTQYVVVRAGEPALHVRLSGHRHDSLLVGTPAAAELAQELAAGRSRP